MPVEIVGNVISYNSANGSEQASGGGINIYYTPDPVMIKNNEISYNELTSDNIPTGGGIFSQFVYDYFVIENNNIHHNWNKFCFNNSNFIYFKY